MTTATAPSPIVRSEPRGLRVQGMSVRRWLRTTPGHLRAWSVGLLVVLLAVGTVVGTAVQVRWNAARSVGSAGAPELVASEDLYSSLADADATASIIFLQAGRESPELRQRYESDVQEAGQHLATVAKDAGASRAEQTAVQEISSQLPIYAGYIETARANGSLGYPVGAAYLRQGSSLMRGSLLPAAITVYEQAATRLDNAYRSGTSTTEILLVVLAGVLLFVLLVGVQVRVARRSRRILNPGLVGSTAVVIGLLGWTIVQLGSAQGSLVDAQRKGSDTVQFLSATRILTLQAQSDDNTALIERGSGQSYITDFTNVLQSLNGTTGQALLPQARLVAARTGSAASIDRISSDLTTLGSTHAIVRGDDNAGNYTAAVTEATGAEADIVTKIDDDVALEIASAQQRLDRSAADARSGFGTLAVGIPVLIILSGLLAFVGLQRRIGEYR